VLRRLATDGAVGLGDANGHGRAQGSHGAQELSARGCCWCCLAGSSDLAKAVVSRRGLL
jgi:hypothetical protein